MIACPQTRSTLIPWDMACKRTIYTGFCCSAKAWTRPSRDSACQSGYLQDTSQKIQKTFFVAFQCFSPTSGNLINCTSPYEGHHPFVTVSNTTQPSPWYPEGCVLPTLPSSPLAWPPPWSLLTSKLTEPSWSVSKALKRKVAYVLESRGRQTVRVGAV